MLVSFDLKSGAWVPVRSAYFEVTSEREKVLTSPGFWITHQHQHRSIEVML